jgi:hypothetical protein
MQHESGTSPCSPPYALEPANGRTDARANIRRRELALPAIESALLSRNVAWLTI